MLATSETNEVKVKKSKKLQQQQQAQQAAQQAQQNATGQPPTTAPPPAKVCISHFIVPAIHQASSFSSVA